MPDPDRFAAMGSDPIESQALHASVTELPIEAARSVGYYSQSVVESTAQQLAGWRDRLAMVAGLDARVRTAVLAWIPS